MAKTYGGRIRRTGRGAKKRVQRIVAKARSTTLAARPGLNVSSARGARFFASLPPMMRLKIPWQADTNYTIAFNLAARPILTGYWFIDPLRYDQSINIAGVGADGSNTRANRGWFSADLESIFFQYSEGRFRTHSLSTDFILEITRNYGVGTTTAEAFAAARDPTISMCCAAVPLSYLRNAGGGIHNAADAGSIILGGPDYYSALSKTSGTRSFILTSDGSSRAPQRVTMNIDGFEHNGSIQAMTVEKTWTPASSLPTLTATHPNPATRQVYLFAFRANLTAAVNTVVVMNMRTAYRLDQHMEFYDRTPMWPYSAANAGN